MGNDYVRENRDYWNQQAVLYATWADRAWSQPEPNWGIWSIPERELRLFPDEVEGQDVVELGCGTAYVSSWIARRGARVVGLDNAPAQLATARAMQRQHGLEFPLLLGNAEELPFADGSFDFAISEYGAAIWCDPYRWIPEASRVLRPGGRLAFLGNGAIFMLCTPDLENDPITERLLRPYFGMHRFSWPDTPGIEFHITHGAWIALLRDNGFEILALHELQAPAGAERRLPFADPAWSHRWPSEEVWVARKHG